MNGEDAARTDAGEAGRALGAACEVTDAAACAREKAICLTSLMVLSNEVAFEGGYCSAPCEHTEDCGTDGDCPVGETRAQLEGSPAAALFANLPSNCLKRCEESSDCREQEGYACGPLTSALPAEIRPIAQSVVADKPIASKRFCVPAAQLADGGT